MERKLQRKDFIIKDLVVSVAGGSRGGTWLPGPDDETPPSPISPVASVLVNIGIIESVRATIMDALESKKGFESIGQAFVPGKAGGNPAIRSATVSSYLPIPSSRSSSDTPESAKPIRIKRPLWIPFLRQKN